MMVVFDVDDTLFRESGFVHSGKEAVRAYISSRGLDMDVDDPWTDEIKQVYRNHWPAITLTRDAQAALDCLKSHGIKIGVITDGRLTTQSNKISALGLNRYVDPANVIISEAIGADKHTPIPFETMMRRNPEEATFIYIGDNPAKDFRYPNLLGWTTVMLIDPDGSNVHPQDIQRDQIYRPAYKVRSIYEYVTQLCKP